VVFLNESGAAILGLCDGRRTVAGIAAELGSRYGADVTADVTEFLDDLSARELVDVG
jgi:pyrroloquinoline quinone biosynthesis protein D